jgi:hypothetical protein
MIVAKGSIAYNADISPVAATGLIFLESEIDKAISTRLIGLIWDDAGRDNLEELLDGLATTAFGDANLRKVLEFSPALEDWRVGEALAETYLTDHRNCEFPWPGGRDLKNPSASPAGTDLVGFQHRSDGVRFCFGEVKTSPQEKWPPSLMNGRHGLKGQLEALRNSRQVTNHLVAYLGHHAKGSSWEVTYKSAAKRYLGSRTDYSVFGVLIRDVDPKDLDLSARAKSLAKGCPKKLSIELLAFYLPKKTISKLGKQAAKARKTSP